MESLPCYVVGHSINEDENLYRVIVVLIYLIFFSLCMLMFNIASVAWKVYTSKKKR